MKKAEITVGGLYRAKVNGRLVTVRVDLIREVPALWSNGREGGTEPHYDVTNLATGRKTMFRSASKFRERVQLPQLKSGGTVGYYGNGGE